MSSRFLAIPVIATMLFLAACSSGPEYPVHSHVEGRISVSAAVDSIPDFSEFLVTVVTQTEGDVDTLGSAVTNAAGDFRMDVRAPEEGIYPLLVERAGRVLSVDEFVAVHGDSVRITGTYPLGARRLRIVSPENAAWAAYRNTKAQHNREMLEVIGNRDRADGALRQVVTRTSSLLWSLRDLYPDTYGSRLASAESIVMLEGWDDSLVVERVALIAPDHDGIGQVARALRRSTARLQGQDAAISAVESLLERVTVPAQRAEILSELVMANSDSLNTEGALAAATRLRREHGDSRWADWADRATYELENLQPGMPAPAFEVTTRTGDVVSSSSLSGRFFILEFFDPREQIFQREFAQRDAIFSALDGEIFRFVSISVEPDTVVNEALFDGASHPGRFVWEPEGLESRIARDYNVNVLPTRVLVDPEGQIVAKYSGSALTNLESDLVAIVTGLNELASDAQPEM